MRDEAKKNFYEVRSVQKTHRGVYVSPMSDSDACQTAAPKCVRASAPSARQSTRRHKASATSVAQIAAHLKQTVIKPLCLCTNQRHTRVGVGHETGYVVYALVQDRAETHEDTAAPSHLASRAGSAGAAASSMMHHLASSFIAHHSTASMRKSTYEPGNHVPASPAAGESSSSSGGGDGVGHSGGVSGSSRTPGHAGSALGDTLLQRRRGKMSIGHLRLDPSYNMDSSHDAHQGHQSSSHANITNRNKSNNDNNNSTNCNKPNEKAECRIDVSAAPHDVSSAYDRSEDFCAYDEESNTDRDREAATLLATPRSHCTARDMADERYKCQRYAEPSETFSYNQENRDASQVNAHDYANSAFGDGCVRARRSSRRGVSDAYNDGEYVDAVDHNSEYRHSRESGEAGTDNNDNSINEVGTGNSASSCTNRKIDADHDEDEDEDEMESMIGFEGGGVGVMALLYEQHVVAVTGGGPTPLCDRHTVCIVRGGLLFRNLPMPHPVVQLFMDARLLFVCTTHEFRVYTNPMEPEWCTCAHVMSMVCTAPSSLKLRSHTHQEDADGAACRECMGEEVRSCAHNTCAEEDECGRPMPAGPSPPPRRTQPPSSSTVSCSSSSCSSASASFSPSAATAAYTHIHAEEAIHGARIITPSHAASAAPQPWPCVIDYARSRIVLRSSASGCGFTLLSYDIYNTHDSSLSGQTSLTVRTVAMCAQAHKNPISGLALHMGMTSQGVNPSHSLHANTLTSATTTGRSDATFAAAPSNSHPSSWHGGEHAGAEESIYNTSANNDNHDSKHHNTENGVSGTSRSDRVEAAMSAAYGSSSSSSSASREICLVAACSEYATRVTLWALTVTSRVHSGSSSSNKQPVTLSTASATTEALQESGAQSVANGEMTLPDAVAGPSEKTHTYEAETTPRTTTTTATATTMRHQFVILREFRVGFKLSAGGLLLTQFAMHHCGQSFASPHRIYHLQFLDNGRFLFCVRNNRMLVFSLESESEVKARDMCHDHEQAVHNRRSMLTAITRVLPSQLNLQSYTKQDWSSCEAPLNVNDAVFHPRWLYLYKQDRAAASMSVARELARSCALARQENVRAALAPFAPVPSSSSPTLSSCAVNTRANAHTTTTATSTTTVSTNSSNISMNKIGSENNVVAMNVKVGAATMIGATLRGTFGRLARGIHDLVGAVNGGTEVSGSGATVARPPICGKAAASRQGETCVSDAKARTHTHGKNAYSRMSSSHTSNKYVGEDCQRNVNAESAGTTVEVMRSMAVAAERVLSAESNTPLPPLFAEVTTEEAITQLAGCLMIWEHSSVQETAMDLYTCRDARKTVSPRTASTELWSGMAGPDLESEERVLGPQSGWVGNGARRKIVLNCVTCEGAYATIRVYKDSGEIFSSPAVRFRID